MIDPVTGAANTAAASHLQLVPPSSATTASKTDSKPQSPGPSVPAGPSVARIYVGRTETGIFVYRLVDALTGQVLAEIPREDSQSLKVLDAYTPGAVASESA